MRLPLRASKLALIGFSLVVVGCGGGSGGSEGASIGLSAQSEAVAEAIQVAPSPGVNLVSTSSSGNTVAALLSAKGSVKLEECPAVSRVSIDSYGANGFDQTSDTGAIQAAINAAPAGSTVIFPKGTYRISSTLFPKSSLTLCAPEGATLLWVGGADNLMDASRKADVDALNIYNLTFDGASLVLKGSNNRVKNNRFQNINKSASGISGSNYDASRRFGIVIAKMTNGEIVENSFENIDIDTGILGYGITGTVISYNYFQNVREPIHIFDMRNSVLKRNVMTGATRMGIEVQGQELPGNVIEENYLADWKPFAGESHMFGLSVTVGDGTVVRRNVLICGAGCEGASKGWGMELGGKKLVIENNVVAGFSLGIGVATVLDAQVRGNAIYDALIGISKMNQGDVMNSLRIEQNYVHNARDTAIFGDWAKVRTTLIQNNLVTRRPGAWTSDSASRHFKGIALSPVGTGGQSPLMVSGNSILLEGDEIPGFQFSAIGVGGYMGNMAGTVIERNWAGATSSSARGVGVWFNSQGAADGVLLRDNVFQNLKAAAGGAIQSQAGAYIASGNQAFNSDIVWSGLATHQIVVVPETVIAASPSGGATAPFTAVLSALLPAGYAFESWYFGDGTRGESVASLVHTFEFPGTMTVRASAVSSQGVRSWAQHVVAANAQ